MSQPWSYYASGYYQYPYYSAYGYYPQGYANSQQPSEEATNSAQVPDPPGEQSDKTSSSAAVAVQSQPAYDPYNAYYHYSMGTYTNDPALDAALRWNAVNCSYYHTSGNASNPTVDSQKGNEINGQAANTNSETCLTKTITSSIDVPKLYEPGSAESKWSPELKEYVQRAFLCTETPVEKDQMERILRQKIEYVFRNNVSVDWTKEPIPTLPTKCAAVGFSSATKSSVNVVRPVPLQPWRTRARNAGSLPTGTLTRNQSAFVLSGKVDAVEKPNIATTLPLGSNNHATEVCPLSKFPESTKRKRPIRQRSRSSSGSSFSSSPTYRNQSCSPKRRSSRSPVNHGNKRRRYHRDSCTDSDHFMNDRVNSNESDATSPVQGLTRGRRGRNKKRGAGGRKKSPKKSPNTSPTKREGKRVGSARGRGGGKASSSRWDTPNTSQNRLNQRADRFKDHLGAGFIAKSTKQLSLLTSSLDTDQLSDKLQQFNIVGTMLDLEKPYLRLTSAPDPANVRPPDVLKKALAHIKQRWKERNDYLWVCEQLKSIRQDLTVQRIQTEFTAEVYEAHADIALEAGDSQEFHQCQSQLFLLHAEGLGSSRRTEFAAYRLLYYIFTQDLLGMSTLLASLKESEKSNPFIRFALKVREAWALRNYKRFFHFACGSDSVGSFETETSKLRGCQQILSWSLDRERKFALKAIFKTYRPHLSFKFVTQTLGFESAISCADFIVRELGVPAGSVEGVEKVDCKEIWSQMRLSGVADAVDN